MIKKLFPSLIGLLCVSLTHAQNPVSWSFSAKKVADKTYEIRLISKVDHPWHIYSQTTPEGGPLPTKIVFGKNPLLNVQGEVKEVGKLVQKREEVFDLDVKYFEGQADFVQVIKLKSNVKTNISGTVEFMVCNDVQCLPPATVNFSIPLQ